MNQLDWPWLRDAMLHRFGSEAAWLAALPRALGDEALARKGADRYLSAMTQRIFQAGVRHEVVDAKWPAFEEAFGGFDVQAMARMGADDVQAHMGNARIVRDRAKLQTIARNARFILEVEQQQACGFGEFIARWPVTDIVGLWHLLAERGARLGGRSAAGFLRLAGKDTFLLTSDVVRRLVLAGVVARTPTARRDLQAAQQAFNALHEASGRPMCELSAMLSYSMGPGG